MRPALDPTGHRVPRTKPTCLLHTWRPHRRRPFALVLHLHQHESSRNLHLQYLAKNQSTQRCQSLITQRSAMHRSSNHTWSSISPLMSALTTPTRSNTREKEKEKKQLKKKPTSDRKPKQGKEQDHLKKTSLGPLRQGQRLDTSETNKGQEKSAKHRTKARTPQGAPPAHMQAPPEPKHTPLEQMQQCNTRMQQRAKNCSLCPGRLDRLCLI
jgi:hypothetical protein